MSTALLGIGTIFETTHNVAAERTNLFANASRVVVYRVRGSSNEVNDTTDNG